MLTWTSRYGVETAPIGRIGVITVAWSGDRSNPGYKVSAFGVNLKELFQDMNEGRRRGEALARWLLAEAILTFSD